LFCAQRYDLFWRNFHGLMRRMYIMLLLDEVICRHQLGLLGLWCHLVLGFLCWFFCLDNLSIGDRVILNCPTNTVLESICTFKSFSVCLVTYTDSMQWHWVHIWWKLVFFLVYFSFY
jgi:hypothetical protein